MEGTYVPWNFNGNTRCKFRQFLQFVITVIEAANQQSHDLHPNAVLVQPANGVEDRPDAPTELPIMLIIETLEIDFVEIDPWPDVLEHLRSSISIRDECRLQACSLGDFEYFDCPLRRNQWLVVGAHQNLCTLPNCIANQQIR